MRKIKNARKRLRAFFLFFFIFSLIYVNFLLPLHS